MLDILVIGTFFIIGFLLFKQLVKKGSFKKYLENNKFKIDKIYGSKSFIAFDFDSQKIAIGHDENSVKIFNYHDILEWRVRPFANGSHGWHLVELVINDVKSPTFSSRMQMNPANECYATLTAAIKG